MKLKTILSNGMVVSTVALPASTIHAYEGARYETMLFPSESDYLDLKCQRNSTAGDALRTHVLMVYNTERKENAEEIEKFTI